MLALCAFFHLPMFSHLVLYLCLPYILTYLEAVLLALQIHSLKQAMIEKEADLLTHKEQLIRDLEKLRINEQRLKDSVQILEAESSQLRLNLCSTESRAEALASEYQRASSAHWEARSQLTKLHSVLHYMLCNSPEAMLEHGGRGDQATRKSSLSLSRGQFEKQA